jgi:D-glycero-D-manno-heptose 1,7-bisphosphate phosphatase
MHKVVFIDRDGVINKDLWKYVEHWGEFEFLPGVLDSLKKLTDEGYEINIISNQGGIGDGIFSESALEDINMNMVEAVRRHGGRIAKTYYCVHSKKAGCECRKPKIGLFEQAFKDFPYLVKPETFFIGDKASDMKAGRDFGVRTIMVMTGYGEREKGNLNDDIMPDYFAADLSEAIPIVLERERTSKKGGAR